MHKITLILVTLILTLTALPAPAGQAALEQQVGSVGDLWLDISMGPPLVEWFNQTARSDDIARVDFIKQTGLLNRVKVGRKLVVFKTVAEAEELLPTLADRLDVIGYNLENGLGYAAGEQADPVGSVKRMHDLAREYDLPLAFGPDHRLALSDGVAIAPYVDILVLQIQRVQTEPDLVRDFVMPLIPRLRRANPDLQITVQVRTEGDVEALVDLIDTLKDDLDGVSILTSPETVEVAEALVAELRAQEATPRSRSTAERPVARPEDRTKAGPAGPLTPVPLPDPWLFWFLMAGLALIAGLAGGGAVAGLLRRPRRKASRK
jgi:hypothetical protein